MDSAGASQSIMQLEEVLPLLLLSFNVFQAAASYFLPSCLYQVKAAVGALRNTRGLNWPSAFGREAADLDLLDWLKAMFGFQACK